MQNASKHKRTRFAEGDRPAKHGAAVAADEVEQARQVFAVRRMLECEMARAFVAQVTPAKIRALRDHTAQEKRFRTQADGRRGLWAHRLPSLFPKPVTRGRSLPAMQMISTIMALHQEPPL